jgi:hypothetical protein
MLSKLYKDHQEKQHQVEVQNERRRKEVLASVAPVTDALMDSVNKSVNEIFQNQRQIETEAQKMKAETARFTKQTRLWLNTIDSFNNSLKELGDFEGYAASIEGEMRTVAGCLEMISGKR